MKSLIITLVFNFFFMSFLLNAQEIRTPEGVRILKNKSFNDSEEERQKILNAFKDLRLTDVNDAMDLIGLQDIGLMKKEIRPLWRDVETFSHRFVGFAITVRHLPSDVRVGENSFSDLEGFENFKKEQYGRAPDQWMDVVKAGDVVVIDANGVDETGFIGSNNSMWWAAKGVVGVVTNGGARDTDEIIKTKVIPVYIPHGYSTRGVRPGRLIAESYNFPINCGGVTVFPGDVIIADGDGVLVVPRQKALEVAEIAREIHIGDERSRANAYKELGIPLDETVEGK